MSIMATAVTARNFAPYGRVVVTPRSKPTSEGPEYRFWSDLAHYGIQGETEIGICVAIRQRNSLITGMERHLATPEILIPIDAPFVLPVLAEGKDPRAVKAFRVGIGEAVVIDPGVWHAACLPLGRRRMSSYFVIFKRNTPHEDVEKRSLAPCAIGNSAG